MPFLTPSRAQADVGGAASNPSSVAWPSSAHRCWQEFIASLIGRARAVPTPHALRQWSPLAAEPESVPIDSLNQAVMIADASARLVAVNPAFSAITGYASHEVLQRNPRLLKSGRHDDTFYAALWARLQHDGVWQGEIWNRRRDGTLFPAWQTISLVRQAGGEVARYVSVFSDISALKPTEAQLWHLAHHDPLTGLPNRLLLGDELERSMSRARRHDQPLALLFIDLDGFKAVNDRLGHQAGDEVLRAVGARLRQAVRAEDAVARLGGDEFIVVLEEIAGTAAAHEAARKLRQAIGQPVPMGGQMISVSASIGVALYPDDGHDAEALIHAADGAMYRGKPGASPAPSRPA